MLLGLDGSLLVTTEKISAINISDGVYGLMNEKAWQAFYVK